MTSEQQPSEDTAARGVAGTTDDGRVYVVTPNSMAVEGPPSPEVEDPAEDRKSVTDMVEQPAKVMRIGNMIRQLLDEVKAAPLDEASRQRLRSIHSASVGVASSLNGSVIRSSSSTSSGARPCLSSSMDAEWMLRSRCRLASSSGAAFTSSSS